MRKLLLIAFLAVMGLGLVLSCGDDDDDNNSADNGDDSDCTEQDFCERQVECDIVASVAECIDNTESCPYIEEFVACMCECQAQFDDCAIESCIPQCSDTCSGGA